MKEGSVLMSIKPKYCELIANGKKTIEVRKSKPKIDTPFVCYIYCTKEKTMGEILLSNNNVVKKNKGFRETGEIPLSGKVIGEFVCDEILEIPPSFEYYSDYYDISDDTLDKARLTMKDLHEYGNGKTLYGWHISNPEIYRVPREPLEFEVQCSKKSPCEDRCYSINADDILPFCEVSVGCNRHISRPPQSWCYVEIRNENRQNTLVDR